MIKNNIHLYYSLNPEHIGKIKKIRVLLKEYNELKGIPPYTEISKNEKDKINDISMEIVNHLKGGKRSYLEFDIKSIEIDNHFPDINGYIEDEDIINKYFKKLLMYQIGILYETRIIVTKRSNRDYVLREEEKDIYYYSVFRDEFGIYIQKLNPESNKLRMPSNFYQFCEQMGLTLYAAKDLYNLNNFYHKHKEFYCNKFRKNKEEWPVIIRDKEKII